MNTDLKRYAFESAKIKNPGDIVAPSFLRIIKEIDNSTSRYIFDVKKNGNEKSIEKKLDRNDTFFITGIGFFLIAVVSSKYGKAQLQTYPNKQIFVPTAAFDPDDLEAFYNASLKLKVESTVWIENMNMRDAFMSRTTQKSSSANYSEIHGNEDGIIQVDPIKLMGTSNIEIELDVPVFSGIKVANDNSNTVNYAVLQPVGYLVKSTRGSEGRV